MAGAASMMSRFRGLMARLILNTFPTQFLVTAMSQ